MPSSGLSNSEASPSEQLVASFLRGRVCPPLEKRDRNGPASPQLTWRCSLFVERNARAATIVTSNRDTSEWLAVFDDTLLAQSAVDRFKNNAYDLIIDGESYRARLKPTVDADPPPPAAPVQKPSSARRRGALR
ncbi:MAG: ATP-binding protein [Polyangiaceae bacterium]|nr:ATP-binding protein [Polyangiaceae bacterium]